MQTKGISQTAKNLGGIISKNSPTILTGLAVCGLVTTVIFAVRATPRAMQILECERQERWDGDENDPRDFDDYTLPKWDIIKIAWKPYIPAVAMGTVTIACIISSNSINQRRNAALATVYGLTETAFREYKEKVVETIGKNKELKVRDDICADHVAQNPVGRNEVIITGKGNVLCMDSLSGRYFRSDIDKVRKSINSLNEEMLGNIGMWISVNELYDEIGLAHTSQGDMMGWDLDQGTIRISYSSQLTENEEPCLVLNYDIQPKYLR